MRNTYVAIPNQWCVMAKPLVVTIQAGPSWTIHYRDIHTDEEDSIIVVGPPTSQEAKNAAHESLSAERQDWFLITEIELNQ